MNSAALCLRLGTRWRREPGRLPRDRVGLEIHGLDLLAGASDELFFPLLTEWLGAVTRSSGGARWTSVELPGAGWRLGMERVDGSALALYRLPLSGGFKPPPPARLDLDELRAALDAGASRLLRDWERLRGAPAESAGLAAALIQLRGGPLQPPRSAPDVAWPRAVTVEGPLALCWEGGPDRGAVRSGDPAALGFVSGRLQVLGPGPPQAYPGVALLPVAEALVDSALALLEPAGASLEILPPPFDLRFEHGRLLSQRGEAVTSHEALARSLLTFGHEAAALLVELHPPCARLPEVAQLLSRTVGAWAGLNGMRTSPLPPSPASAASPGFQAGPRLAGRGRALKRLAFEQAWQQVVPGADRLLLDRADGITAWGRTGLGAFTPGGRPRLELRGLDGLAVAPGGAYAVLREGEALVGLRLDGRLPGRALWRRSPSTLVPREPLVSGSATLFLLSAGQGALGLASHTGREQWRLQLRGGTWPLGAQGRCWLTTELGSVLQVHPDSGAVGAAVHCPLPFHGPANLHGRQLSAVASDADRSELMVLDAASGEPLLRRALALGRAGPAVPLARRWFLAGERAGEARILALTASGRTVWERPLPFAGPWRLLPCAGGLLATNRAGAAVCVETTGKLRWTAGSGAPDETEQPLAPAVRRGVAFAFGPEVRALDARSGGLLAALPLKAPAVAAAVGRSLGVYVLDESGRLTAWRLATHLSAVRRG